MIERSSEKRTRNSKQTANALGILFEERALRYLTRQGLIALNKNYRCPRGEIDLVMQDPETQMIVFVEVRARYRSDFGGAAETITLKKQQSLSWAAQHYLLTHQLEAAYCRFDVLLFNGGRSEPVWLQSAFESVFESGEV